MTRLHDIVIRTSLATLMGLTGMTWLGCPDDGPSAPIAVTSRPQDGRDELLERAREAIRRGSAREATALLRPFVRDRPDDYDARLVLASALLVDDQPREALREANLALAIDQGPAGAWVTKAAALTALGDDAQAIVNAERALEREPEHRGALTNLVTLLDRAGQTERLRELLERIVALDEGDFAARFRLATLALDDDDLPAAERHARAIVARDARHRPAQRLLAAVAYAHDDYPGALERARIALSLAPEGREVEDDGLRAILEAAFYITVSAELTCTHGPRPWDDAATARILAQVRDRYELTGVGTFYDLDAAHGSGESVAVRVARAAAKLCPDRP